MYKRHKFQTNEIRKDDKLKVEQKSFLNNRPNLFSCLYSFKQSNILSFSLLNTHELPLYIYPRSLLPIHSTLNSLCTFSSLLCFYIHSPPFFLSFVTNNCCFSIQSSKSSYTQANVHPFFNTNHRRICPLILIPLLYVSLLHSKSQ